MHKHFGVAFRSAIPKPEDIGHVAASNFGILRVQLQIRPQRLMRSNTRILYPSMISL